MKKPGRRTLATLALALATAAGSASAQPSAIHRSTAGSSHLGEFPVDAGTRAPPPPPPPRARGDVGGTGTVDHERGPQGEIRGSTGAAPGEIDFSRPIGAADVARLLRMQEPRLRTCYDAARATRPRLAGRASLRLVVSRTGELTDVSVVGFPDAPAVAPCMAAELRQVRFPRPESGVLPFNYAMNFSPPPAPPPRAVRQRSRPR
ncbi:MAG: AgmX/PglI C-terminal domain-containing protein [Myxococcales bacterium]|nr:AgmX/PglI C-terminal domain-containing protein [Myxococcales bacterium]